MSWSEGVGYEVPAGTVPQAVAGLVHDAIVANPAWEVVIRDWQYQSNPTYASWSVYRCLGSANGVADWYLWVGADNANSYVNIFMSEEYRFDGAQSYPHRFKRAGPSTGTGVPAAADWDQATHAYKGAVEGFVAANYAPGGGVTNNTYTVVSTGTLDYWIRVTARNISFGFAGAFNHAQFLGLFDSAVVNPTVNDPLPLAAIRLNFNNSSTTSVGSNYWGNVTNNPMVDSYNWAFLHQAAGGLALDALPLGNVRFLNSTWGTGFVGGSNDMWQHAPVATPVMVVQYLESRADARRGGVRGYLPGVVALGAGNGVQRGDIVVVEGHDHTIVVVSATTVIALQKDLA